MTGLTATGRRITAAIDRGVKVPAYRLMPSVREIVLVDQDRPLVEVLRRQDGDRWLSLLCTGRNAVLTLATVPVRLPLAELHKGVGQSREPGSPGEQKSQ